MHIPHWEMKLQRATSDHLFAGSMQKGALRAVPDVNRPANLQQRVNTPHAVVAYLRMHSAF